MCSQYMYVGLCTCTYIYVHLLCECVWNAFSVIYEWISPVTV